MFPPFRFLTQRALPVLALPLAAMAQRDLKDIPPVDPEVEKQSFQLAEGLEATLFAADPQIRKPIQIAWDQQGRLWVASSETYPQIKPGDGLEDEILVLEDTDRDGKADKVTKYADHLLIPTGLFPTGPGEAAVLGFGDGDKGAGCYVANSTQLLFLRDTDGDGKADKREILLSGFGTEDTHHILHTFRGGPDGSFYFNQSIYIHTHLETPFGVRRLGGGGVLHYWPETGQVEVFTRGQVNPWGHVFDRWGQSFTTDGAYGEGVNFAFPGAAFFWAKEDDWTKDFPRILKGLNPGQPKQCGIEIVSGRHFPVTWQGSMVLPDFRGNRINRFTIAENGSGYASKQVEDVIKTTHRAFRPVDVKMGPDGALYIADWYNPIIQHGEVDFRDDRRDHTHGRVWRLSFKDRPALPQPKIAGAPIPALIEQLKAPEDWTRFFAKRELRERAMVGRSNSADRIKQREAASAAIGEWSRKLDATDADLPHDRLEALWASMAIGQIQPTVLELLNSPEPRARAAALRFVHSLIQTRDPLLPRGDAAETVQSLTLRGKIGEAGWVIPVGEVLEKAISDEHPRVRLEAIHCLRVLRTAKASELALRALDKPMDEFLDFALWLNCRENQDIWLPAFQKGEIAFGGNGTHAVFALKATGNAAALAPLIASLKEGRLAAKDQPQVLQLIASMGGPGELSLLLDLAKDAPALDLLTQTVRTRKVKPANAEKALAFLDAENTALKAAGARLAGALKLEAAREKLVAWLGDPKGGDGLHQAALDGLVGLGGDATRRAVVATVEKIDAPLGQRAMAVQALSNIDLKDAAGRAVTLLENPGSAAVAGGIFDAFLTKKEGPAALTAALSGKKLPEEVAKAGLQKAGSAPGDTRPLQEALATAANLKPLNQAMSPEEMQALVAEVKEKGDAARGQVVYRRREILCQTCHGISGGGPEIGPNLVSIGASAQIDYLIESLLNPSAKIKEGYHTAVVTTKDGNVLAGAIASKDDQKIVLRDATGALKEIATANVEKNEIQPVSLMPPGLTASLRKDEFLDLVRFLSEIGREGAFKVPPQNYNRRWRVLNYSNAVGRAHNLGGDRLFATDDPALTWLPAYSDADGSLPQDLVTDVKLWSGMERRVVQCELEMTTPGTVSFAISGPAGLKLVTGEQIVDVQPVTKVTLPAGIQKIALFSDTKSPNAPLKLELTDAPANTGRGRWVNGR